jgi:DNA-binding MarR family transcriptional regulator
MDLSPDEVQLIFYLDEHGETSAEILAQRSYVKVSEIERHLTNLLVKQLISKDSNGNYRIMVSKAI